MTARRTWISPLGIFLILGIAVACGGGLDAISESAAVGAPGAPGRPERQRTTVVETVVVEKVVAQSRVAATPVPAATPAPALLRAEGGFDLTFTEGASSLSTALDREVAAVAAQQRIIVRTVSMELQVDDVTLAIEAISSISESLGGWVVSSERSAQHRGSISVRVPAERLDEALSDMRALAASVESERATSQDFTDEYTDTTARVRALEATEAVLFKLFERADKVEDAIRVQAELTKIQADIERLKGRLTLLEQTSAFSLVNVELRAVPLEMAVDAGLDLTLAVGHSTRFRVSFQPPEGIDEFEIVWDFGDGSLAVVTRTAPTLEEGMLIAAPVSHVYGDDTDSPFIVTVEINGTGEAGLAEGSDTLIATVSRIPAIEIFAGNDVTAEAGERVEFIGSFTRPEGLDNLTFEWNFGDGSAPVAGELAPGVTTAAASHVYSNHRPFPFTATLKVTGDSEAGKAEDSSTTQVRVVEAPGLVGYGLDAGDTSRDAVRVLSSIGNVSLQVLIWIGILSAIWVPLGAVAFVAYRRRGRSAR